jgi:hypothetical protein
MLVVLRPCHPLLSQGYLPAAHLVFCNGRAGCCGCSRSCGRSPQRADRVPRRGGRRSRRRPHHTLPWSKPRPCLRRRDLRSCCADWTGASPARASLISEPLIPCQHVLPARCLCGSPRSVPRHASGTESICSPVALLLAVPLPISCPSLLCHAPSPLMVL